LYSRMVKNKNMEMAFKILRPLIEKEARSFSKCNGHIDSSEFEDVAYQEIYRYYEKIMMSDGNLSAIIPLLIFSARRAMRKLAVIKKLSPFKDIDIESIKSKAIELSFLYLDRYKVLQEIRRFDSRLGDLCEKYMTLKKPFDTAGEKSYFYRGLKRFTIAQGGRYLDPRRGFSSDFYILFGNN